MLRHFRAVYRFLGGCQILILLVLKGLPGMTLEPMAGKPALAFLSPYLSLTSGCG